MRASVAVVAAHAAVLIVHGLAHARLHIELVSWEKAWVAGVIGIAPIAAVGAMFTGHIRVGAATLAIGMAGALLFGLWKHFLVMGPDHVAHVPDDFWKLPFQLTSGLLVVTEASGSAIGFALWRRVREQEGREREAA